LLPGSDNFRLHPLRTGIISLFFIFFLVFPSPSSGHLTIKSGNSLISVDERFGSFAFTRSGLPDSGLLESDNAQLSSFVVVFEDDKPLLVGGDRGRIDKCRFVDNSIEYSWRTGPILATEMFFFSSGPETPSPGIRFSLSSPIKNRGNPIKACKILLLLDLADASVFDLENRIKTDNFMVWTNLANLVIANSGRYFRLKPLPETGSGDAGSGDGGSGDAGSGDGGAGNSPCLVILGDWKELNRNLGSDLLNLKAGNYNNDRIRDKAVALVWSVSPGSNRSNTAGIQFEEFKPEPEDSVCCVNFTGPSEILPSGSKIGWTIRNNSFVPLRNASLALIADDSVDANRKSVPLGDIPAFSCVTQEFGCSSRSAVDRSVRLQAVLESEYGSNRIVSTAEQDCLIRPTRLNVACDLITNLSPPTFRIMWLSPFSSQTQFLRIEDLDGQLLARIKVPARDSDYVWNRDPLPSGTSYYYRIEAVRGTDVFSSDKKIFTTDPERVEDSRTIVIKFPAVNFNYKSAALKSQAYTVLKKVAVLLRQYPDKKIRIDGYTDNTGSRQVNLELSSQRASAVKDYLTGVEELDSSKFECRGMAEANPVAPNDSEENRFKNRRVEIVIEK